MIKLCIFMSHPIQYQVSLLRKISELKIVDLTVNFYWDFGLKKSYDKEFGREIKWDIPLLSGYNYKFLKNFSLNKSTNFWGCINFGVIKEILSNKHDIYLIYGWAIFSNWLVLILAKLKKKPVLLVSEAPLSHEKNKSLTRKLILKLFFKNIAGFLYIGKQNYLFYKSFNISESKLFFCPYSVDNDRYQIQISNSKKIIRKKKLVILFVGKLIKKKRPIDLLLAFSKLQNKSIQYDNIELAYVGDGIEKKYLNEIIKTKKIKNVKFYGFLNQSELNEVYINSDIFVLPSGIGETWGLVVNEAMNYRLPIIVSDIVGCGNDLVTKNNGFIYPCGDIDKLAHCLELLILDNDMRHNFGNRSFEIIKNYNQNICASVISETSRTYLND